MTLTQSMSWSSVTPGSSATSTVRVPKRSRAGEEAQRLDEAGCGPRRILRVAVACSGRKVTCTEPSVGAELPGVERVGGVEAKARRAQRKEAVAEREHVLGRTAGTLVEAVHQVEAPPRCRRRAGQRPSPSASWCAGRGTRRWSRAPPPPPPARSGAGRPRGLPAASSPVDFWVTFTPSRGSQRAEEPAGGAPPGTGVTRISGGGGTYAPAPRRGGAPCRRRGSRSAERSTVRWYRSSARARGGSWKRRRARGTGRSASGPSARRRW